MRRSTILLGLVCMLALTTVAAAGSEKKLDIPYDCVLDGVELSKGKYKILWEGEGDSVAVTILHKKQKLVETTAVMKPLDEKIEQNYVKNLTADDGTQALTEVGFRGKRYALRFEGNKAAMAKR